MHQQARRMRSHQAHRLKARLQMPLPNSIIRPTSTLRTKRSAPWAPSPAHPTYNAASGNTDRKPRRKPQATNLRFATRQETHAQQQQIATWEHRPIVT